MPQGHRKHAIRLLNGPVPRGHPGDVFPTATGQVPGAAIRDKEGTAVSSRRRLGRAESRVYAPPIMDWLQPLGPSTHFAIPSPPTC